MSAPTIKLYLVEMQDRKTGKPQTVSMPAISERIAKIKAGVAFPHLVAVSARERA